MGQHDHEPAQVRRVAAALTGLGVQHGPRALAHPATTAAEAAAQLGTPVAAIADALLFAADSEPLLVLTSGSHRPDPIVLSALLGAASVRTASLAEVQHWTGQAVGGVAPVGHPRPLPTLVDVELSHFATVWCRAGHSDWVFPTSYAELLRITAGSAAEVGDLTVSDA
jgi:prolyl-tRNA editing enzyme YbaK/EbsC (Cys-tRNA(Pro) deacylase)